MSGVRKKREKDNRKRELKDEAVKRIPRKRRANNGENHVNSDGNNEKI